MANPSDEFEMIGKQIGEYRIIEKRGEGGMGMFYKAVDTRLDRTVGLKTIRAELLDQPELLIKLQDEAKALANLDHPNIARLLHYLVEDSQHFIVMEFVDGQDLAAMVRSSGLLPMDRLGRIIEQTCAAIGYAHNRPQPVIHRDIKPSNILVTKDDVVKVTDFGIAKILGVSARTRTGMATGSLPYMAPEQIQGGTIDARTDVYQLGITLFELASGERPFKADSEYEMMSSHLNLPPPSPSSVNPRVSPSLSAVITKALSKGPVNRHQTAAELGRAVTAALASAPDEAKTTYAKPLGTSTSSATTVTPSTPPAPSRSPGDYRPPSAESPAKPPKRNSRIPMVAIGAICVIVAFGLIWKFAFKSDSSPREVAIHVTANIPEEVPSGQTDIVTLIVRHESGIEQYDSIPIVARMIETEVTIPFVSSTELELRGYDDEANLLFDGLRSVIVSTDSIDVTIELFEEESAEKPIVSKDKQAPSRDSVKKPSDAHEEQPKPRNPPNVTLDVTPFSERERISGLQVDGKPMSGSLPLEMHLSNGIHRIRWNLGALRWTDTVTVRNGSVVRKELTIGSSPVTVNLAAEFVGAAGPYADVVIDGVNLGYGTPVEIKDSIPAGPHEIEFVRGGFRMEDGPLIVQLTPGRNRIVGRLVAVSGGRP